VTLRLHFGVIDVPYQSPSEAPAKRKARLGKALVKPKRPKKADGGKTTGDVATILEDKYGVFEAFFDNNEVAIVDHLEGGITGALESMLMGAPPSLDAFGEGAAKVEEMFKSALSNREIESYGLEGVPTAAARKGVSHRFKHPHAKKNPRRPSFIDTGLYQASSKVWVAEGDD
jgi:hypothetical protein